MHIEKHELATEALPIFGVDTSATGAQNPLCIDERIVNLANLDHNSATFPLSISILYPEIDILIDRSSSQKTVESVLKRGDHPVIEEVVAALNVSTWLLNGNFEEGKFITKDQFEELKKMATEVLHAGLYDGLNLGIILSKAASDFSAMANISSKLGKKQASDDVIWEALKKAPAVWQSLDVTNSQSRDYLTKIPKVFFDLPAFSKGEFGSLKSLRSLMLSSDQVSSDIKRSSYLNCYLLAQICTLIGESSLPSAIMRWNRSDYSPDVLREAVIALRVISRDHDSGTNSLSLGHEYYLRRTAQHLGIKTIGTQNSRSIGNNDLKAKLRVGVLADLSQLGKKGGVILNSAWAKLDESDRKVLVEILPKNGGSRGENYLARISGAATLIQTAIKTEIDPVIGLTKALGFLAKCLSDVRVDFKHLSGAGYSLDLSLLGTDVSTAISDKDKLVINKDQLTLRYSFPVLVKAAVVEKKTSTSTKAVPEETTPKTKLSKFNLTEAVRELGFIEVVTREPIAGKMVFATAATVTDPKKKISIREKIVGIFSLIPNSQGKPIELYRFKYKTNEGSPHIKKELGQPPALYVRNKLFFTF